MKRLVILITTTFLFIFCKAQNTKELNCEILQHFIGDQKILNLLNIDFISRDTIIIIDSCHSFKNFDSFGSHNKEIFIETDVRGLNPSPNFRMDLIKWKYHVLIFKLEIAKSYRKIHFFFKPTNANGFVKYKLRKGKIVSTEYSLGQL